MIYLREVSGGDIDMIFEWANDALVRANSFNTKPIPYENHKSWFSSVLGSDSIRMYIMMNDDIPIGQARLNIQGDEAEISYSIARDYRGKGFGHALLALIRDKVREELPQVHTLIAKVKPDNQTSRHLFEAQGYELKYLCFVLDTLNYARGGGSINPPNSHRRQHEDSPIV